MFPFLVSIPSPIVLQLESMYISLFVVLSNSFNIMLLSLDEVSPSILFIVIFLNFIVFVGNSFLIFFRDFLNEALCLINFFTFILSPVRVLFTNLWKVMIRVFPVVKIFLAIVSYIFLVLSFLCFCLSPISTLNSIGFR